MKNILLILFLLLLGPCLIAQEYITINDKPYRIDTLIYKHRVGPGTEYVYVDLPEFPLKIHVLEIDLKNPKTNRKNAGFTDEERGKFTNLLNAGFIDTFRYFYPDAEGIYSWWSYRFSARKKNAGWRIDYFCVSESLKDRIKDAKILTEIMGSDHCPVELDFE